MKAYVHLAPGFEEMEAITSIDLLRRAGVEVLVVKVGDNKSLLVEGAHGVKLSAEAFLKEADYDKCDMIVLPGGMPGTLNLAASDDLMNNIKKLHSEGKWICAICAAPMILAKAGILAGREATIYPGMEEYIKGAVPTGKAVVCDGNIITGRGPGTAVDFGLALVKALCGTEKCEEIREGLAI